MTVVQMSVTFIAPEVPYRGYQIKVESRTHQPSHRATIRRDGLALSEKYEFEGDGADEVMARAKACIGGIIATTPW